MPSVVSHVMQYHGMLLHAGTMPASHAVQCEVRNSTQKLGGGRGHYLDVSQHELARLLVQQRGHVGLLVGVSRHHQPLYCGGGSQGAKGWQLGFDGPSNPAVPGAPCLLLLSLQPGESITTTCSTLGW